MELILKATSQTPTWTRSGGGQWTHRQVWTPSRGGRHGHPLNHLFRVLVQVLLKSQVLWLFSFLAVGHHAAVYPLSVTGCPGNKLLRTQTSVFRACAMRTEHCFQGLLYIMS